MDRALARRYRERWNAADAEELREATLGWRMEQMDAIYRLAVGLGLPQRVAEAEEDAVWQRWARLKGHRR